MARIEVDAGSYGIKAVADMIKNLGDLPTSVVDAMLLEGIKPVEKALREEASKLNIEGHGTGELERSITVRSPAGAKGKRYIDIEFVGRRKGGRLNSTVAFFNEFGSRKIHARRFIEKANNKSATVSTGAMMRVYDEFVQKG